MGEERNRPATTEAFAKLVARLAHRFSDREAILWRGGLDEDGWAALERTTLAELSRPGASDAELAAFAKAFIAARLELTRGSAIPGPPPSSEDAAPTVPGPTRRPTLELGTPRDAGGYEIPIRQGAVDDPSTDHDHPREDFSRTVHSPGQAPKSDPR